MTQSLASELWRAARQHPHIAAIREPNRVMTYHRLWTAVSACVADLEGHGVGPGKRVALMMPNCPEFTIVYYATLALGAVVVPLNASLTESESVVLLRHAGPHIFVGDEERLPHASAAGIPVLRSGDWCERIAEPSSPAPVDPSETAVILYTSGTTGHPKGVELTHRNLTRNALWVGQSSLDGAQWGSTDTVLAALPLSHSFGQTCLQNAPLLHGASVIYVARFDPDHALDILVKENVTILAAVPQMARLVMESGRERDLRPTTLRWCLIGGAPIPTTLIDAFEKWSGASVLEGYGLSETSPVCVFRTPQTPRRPGSVGRAIEGVELRLALPSGDSTDVGGPGELLVRGHVVMKGYFRQPSETQEVIQEGWLRTGDVARIDEDGLIYIVDRLKDVILRNGYSVYPSEVEAVVARHPLVEDVAVFGVADDRVGEEVAAMVVSTGPSLSPDALRAHCEAHLAPYKRPRRMAFVKHIPRGSKGQVLRGLLIGNLDTSRQGAIY